MDQTTNMNVDTGYLQLETVAIPGQRPIENATVEISLTGNPDSILERFTTSENGITERIALKAPPLEYSMEPSDNQPYSEYNIRITAEGYEEVFLSGVQILPEVTAFQRTSPTPVTTQSQAYDPIVIPGHTLWEFYPPKIAESEIKTTSETGEIVLSEVVIPEFVVVHDGTPSDTTASNYYVRYRDYIKNVASCEIYATWPKATLEANILAIMSFTLNRVYTEWYRNKGYNFTITSSTAFDHKWINQKATFEEIDQIVDEIFTKYLSRPNVEQPILTQYCDGKRVTCPNWLSQWGSKYLGDQGLSSIEILKTYYGPSIYINETNQIAGIPLSWPGELLTIGSYGNPVRTIQMQLNRISDNYPAIPKLTVDGIYGEATQNAVRAFQRIFNLNPSGIVDYSTWYKISEIYVAVTRIAELTS